MADSKQRRPNSRTERARDFRSISRFLEELSWVLDNNSNLDFRAIRDLLVTPLDTNFARHVSKNPNIHFLIGALPIIFEDPRYFPANEDIAEFASEALGLPITRWEKRSRYELIGLIVCQTAKLNDRRLQLLVDGLSKILEDDPSADTIFVDRKKQKLSWNEIIQMLARESRG